MVAVLRWFDGDVQAAALLGQTGGLGAVAEGRLDVSVVVHHRVDVVQRRPEGETLTPYLILKYIAYESIRTVCTLYGAATKYRYIKSTTVYVPSSELGMSQPLSRQRVGASPENRGEGAHSPAGEGLGESQFRRLEKKLSTLPTLRALLYT